MLNVFNVSNSKSAVLPVTTKRYISVYDYFMGSQQLPRTDNRDYLGITKNKTLSWHNAHQFDLYQPLAHPTSSQSTDHCGTHLPKEAVTASTAEVFRHSSHSDIAIRVVCFSVNYEQHVYIFN